MKFREKDRNVVYYFDRHIQVYRGEILITTDNMHYYTIFEFIFEIHPWVALVIGMMNAAIFTVIFSLLSRSG